MILHLLVTEELKPIPNNIKIIDNYGEITIISDEKFVSGNHILVDGSIDAFQEWLGWYDEIWIGKGSPIFQEFQLRHIADGVNNGN